MSASPDPWARLDDDRPRVSPGTTSPSRWKICITVSSIPSMRSTQVHPQMLDQISPDCCRRTILGRAIALATAALQHVHDAADDAAIVHPLDAPDIRWQARLDPLPLLIAQPKQVPAHDRYVRTVHSQLHVGANSLV